MFENAVTITADGYSAEIALRGGQLLSLTSGGADLVVPAAQARGAFAGAVLAPWPNRIAQATYVHDETEYLLEANEEETGAAMHGLLYDLDLTVQFQRASEVHLVGTIQPTEGYPFPVDVVLVYRVGAEVGLSATLMARYTPENDDDAEADSFERASAAPAPFGAGFHPYLTAGGAALKDCRLRLPAQTVARTDSSGEVVGRDAVAGDLDLTRGPLLVGRSIDHAYTGLPEEGWTAELWHGPSGFMVRMIADTPWAQVYTGELIDRAGVAVEPMTCPPNAFNSGEDVVYLAPGQWFRTGFSLEAMQL